MQVTDPVYGVSVPRAQGKHAERPPASWYEPGLRASHAPSLLVEATVPAAHGVCFMLPVGLKNPGLVGVHCAGAERSVTFEKRPLLHGSAAAAPSTQ